MSFVKHALVLVAFVFVAMPAKAGLLLEPYLGYEMGLVDAKLSAGGTSVKLDASGTGIGARIGYTAPLLFFAAIDYSMANLTSKVKEGTGLTGGDVTRTTVYAVGGVDFPILLRAWAGYGFMNDVTIKGTPDTKLSGTAMKFGAGFTGLPIVSINAEYIMSTFNKLDGTSMSSSTYFSDVKSTTIMLSVSAPFDL